MTVPTATELSAYLDAIQDHPFAALLLCGTLVACLRVLGPYLRKQNASGSLPPESKSINHGA